MFQVGTVPVYVYEDKRDLGGAAAVEAAQIMGRAIAARGQARIIVGTGNSQDEVIDQLTAQRMDWKAVEVFHMDEYIQMGHDNPCSFGCWLKTRLVDVVHPRAAHYLAGDAADLEAECQRYTNLLRDYPVDVCFAGFGENGHIAFNDPDVADFQDPKDVKRVVLDERSRQQQVDEGHFPDLAAMPREAVTLTCPALMRAEHLVCVVPDQRKAEAVKNALEGGLTTNCPASLVLTHPNTSIYLDVHSASLLKMPKAPPP